MPLPIAARDTQATWFPTWIFESPALPHVYAGRDLSLPSGAPTGSPFIIGVSAAGGDDLVGAGAVGADAYAWGRITDAPTVTRTITDPFWPIVEVQDGAVTVAAMLSGDYAGQPCTLSRYDAISGLRLYEVTGLITHTVLNRDGTTIEWTSLDRALLETQVPKGLVTSADFPLAEPSAIGKTPPWIFGNVRDLPLLYVRDDQIRSEFDYVVGRAPVTVPALRRVMSPNVEPLDPTPTVDMDFIELEPTPGMDGVLVNGTFENWDVDAAVAPPGWTVIGGTVAKNITAGEVAEGNASASLTRAGTNAFLDQDLMANPDLSLEWWRGRTITVQALVRATVAATTDLRLADSVGGTNSLQHTGGGTFELLSLDHTVHVAATSLTLRCRVATTNTTSQFDDVRVYLKAKSWEEVLRTDLYDGYTALRCFLRQDNGATLYPLVADVNGWQPERNPVRAIRTLLSDATHGAGRVIDGASFKAGEIAASVTYESVILFDAPTLFLPFRDPVPDSTDAFVPLRDRSGHGHWAGAVNGGSGVPIMLGGPSAPSITTPIRSPFANEDDAALALPAAGFGGTAVTVDSSPEFSTQTLSVELWLQIYPGNLPFAGDRPILEKQVGANALSGYGIYRDNNLLVFFVRGADTNFYSVTSPLVDGVDEGRWMHVVGVATGGGLTLYRDGTLVATGSYSGAIAEGDGRVMIGEWGIGASGLGCDWIDNVALYASALPPARIVAHTAAVALDVTRPIVTYQQAQASDLYYLMAENPGSATLIDSSGDGHNGTYVGAPLLGVPGPLNPERGFVNGFGAARFANNVAQYAVETGMTLAGTAGHLSVFYAPAAKKVAAGICEKTIGGVRGTQWGFCQRVGAAGFGFVRFTLVTSGGTVTVDAPLTSADRDRFSLYDATWGSGTIELYKNGQLVASETYSGTPASGVGDFYIGVQGTSGAGLTRPAIGDIAHVLYRAVHLTAETIQFLWTAATWGPGATYVDAALTEPRPLQDWLGQIGQLLGIRLGSTATGALTVSVDVEPPTVIQIDARDGVGDGDRNLVAISSRQRPRLEDRVRDVVVKYRRNLQTGEWLGELRRPVNAGLGRDRVFECEAVREHVTADRFACRAATLLLAREESVEVTLHQEARQLRKGDLIQITDALLDYDKVIMRTRQVRKNLATIEATLESFDENQYVYTPAPPTRGAG